MRPLESSWPVAFYNYKVSVPLAKHLAAVTLCAAELFSHELPLMKERLSPLFEGGREGEKQEERLPHAIGRILLLAAALHDLAKASRRYYPKEGSRKISFIYHELASAYIVYRSAVHDTREKRRIFWTAAKVIARHHAAMEGRHPQDIWDVGKKRSPSEAKGWVSDVIEVIRGLGSSEAQKVVDEVISELRSELKRSSSRFIGYVANELESALKMLYHVRNRIPCIVEPFKEEKDSVRDQIPCMVEPVEEEKDSRLEDDLREDVKQVIRNLAKVQDEVNNKNYYSIVAPLSGALIIADNLVADYERRTSDDEASPDYIRNWQKELMRSGRDISSLSCLQYVESYVSKPNAPALP